MDNRKALTNFLVSAGFTLLRTKNHQIWGCPCGHTRIPMSCSHHEGRGDQNARALIARTLRACRTPKKEEKAA